MRRNISLDEYDDLTLGDERLVRMFLGQNPEPVKRSCVYGLFDRKTGELLYIGQTTKLIRRTAEHLTESRDRQLLERVRADDDVDIEGDLWDRIEVAYVEVPGGRKRRERLERVLEAELDPRYSSR